MSVLINRNATSFSRKKNSIHVIFGAECNNSMDWKSIAVIHSFQTSGWKGNITRVLSCSPEQLKNYNGINICPTFTHPNYKYIEGYKDSVSYNKPAGIFHFSHEARIEEEFLLFIDADMLLRRVIKPSDYGARRGLVISEWVWYIEKGIKNGLAYQFISDLKVLSGVQNTHGGYYHLIHIDDAREISPLWLHYTHEIRHHPERYFSNLPGSTIKEDIDTVQKGGSWGEAPWISEMYGYAFAAAEIGLDHKLTKGGGGVLYGDDFLTLNHYGPFLSHYTLDCHIPSKSSYLTLEIKNKYNKKQYKFDKNDYNHIDVNNCNDGRFLIPYPPKLVDESAASCSENVHRINIALCDFYRKKCPQNSNAYHTAIFECPWELNSPYNGHYSTVTPAPCGDKLGKKECINEIELNRCYKDPSFMQLNCLKSCGFCMDLQLDNMVENQESAKFCKDKISEEICQNLAEHMECLLNPTYMIVNCQKTCGGCKKDVILKSNHWLHGETYIQSIPGEYYVHSTISRVTYFNLFFFIFLSSLLTFLVRLYRVLMYSGYQKK